MYATDNEGLYPPSLDRLYSHVPEKCYMKKLPECCGRSYTFWEENLPFIFPYSYKTQPYGYRISDDLKNFTLWCPLEKTHTGTTSLPDYGCWPQYSPVKGLMMKP
jgi:hypothetical protein